MRGCDELLPRFKLDVLHEQCTACCRTDTGAGVKVAPGSGVAAAERAYAA